MNKTNFTIQDERTLQQLLAEYKEQKQNAERLREQYNAETMTELDAMYHQMTEADKGTYEDYCRTHIFLQDVSSALAFTKASTIVRIEKNDGYDGLECVSLLNNKEEYAENLAILSGGFNKELNAVLNDIAPFEDNFPMQTNAGVEATQMIVPEVRDLLDEITSESDLFQTLTVATVLRTVKETQEQMDRYGIYPENVINDTTRTMAYTDMGLYPIQSFGIEEGKSMAISSEQIVTLYNEGYRSDDLQKLSELEFSVAQTKAIAILLKKLEESETVREAVEQAEKEFQKENIPVEIVESFDGYVLNTNQEITVSNEAEYSRKVENGNEVIHNEAPLHTSSNLSEVGGNIKLEEFDDIGTIEKEEGQLTYEEKVEVADKKNASVERE